MKDDHDEKSITAEKFLAVLAGDDEKIELKKHVVEGKVDIRRAGIRLNENGKYPINKVISCQEWTFKGDVDLTNVQFDGEVNFKGAKFRGEVNFGESIFNGTPNFSYAQFGQYTTFYKAQFCGCPCFKEAHFSNTSFKETKFSKKVEFSRVQFDRPADFANVCYRPNTLFQTLRQEPTEFYLDSHHIDEVSNPRFKRYVADQQYIRAFREAHPILAGIWRWSSDYGRSFGLWAFWR